MKITTYFNLRIAVFIGVLCLAVAGSIAVVAKSCRRKPDRTEAMIGAGTDIAKALIERHDSNKD